MRAQKPNPIQRPKVAVAFTLIELLVVIALVSILIGLILFALGRVRDTARETACASNLHQIGNGVTDYALDNYGNLPTRYNAPGLAFDSFWMRAPDEQFVNLGLLMDRGGAAEMFYCPTQTADTSPAIAHDSPQNPWRVHGMGANEARRVAPVGLNASFTTRARAGARWSLRNFNNKVLYTDFIGVRRWDDSNRFPGGLRQPHKGEGFNRLYGDGSNHWLSFDTIDQAQAVTNAAPNEMDMREYFNQMDVLR